MKYCAKKCATPNLVMRLLIDYFKVTPIGQWGKFLVTFMGIAHTFGHGLNKILLYTNLLVLSAEYCGVRIIFVRI